MALTAGRASAQTTDWLTFGGSNQRQGYNATETTLSQSNVSGLKLLWTSVTIPGIGIDGSAASQPVLLHNVNIGGTSESLVYVGSSHGQVTALNALTGKLVWQVQLPTFTTCGQTYGVDETPTIDDPNQRMFVVDGAGMLHALNVSTGAEIAPYPVQVIDQANLPPHSAVHSGPTLVGSNLYLVTSSPCKDTAPYQGEVIAVNTTTAAVTSRFYPMGSTSGISGGGIWANGGVALGSDLTTLYVGTGNAKGSSPNRPYGESVLKFDLNLNLLDSNTPVTSKGDYDISATPLIFTAAGCPARLAIVGKSGQLFVYDPTAIGKGPLQNLQVGTPSGNAFLYGPPAFDPNTNGVYFTSYTNSPDGTLSRGVIAMQANASCLLSPYWNVPLGSGTPATNNIPKPVTIANGVVYVSYVIGDTAQLVAYADNTGKVLWSSGTLFTAGVYPGPPMVANGQIFVVANGKLRAFGL